MKDLTTFFSNPFADTKIPLGNKKKFGEDTLKRIATQNTANQFDLLLADTLTAQTNLFGAITSVETNSAIQKARTLSVDNLIASFTARNTRLNKYLEANDTNKLPVYFEFFPQGVTAFTREITKGNVQQRMQEMVTAITANTAVAGGAAVLTEYQAFLTGYSTARGDQLTKISDVSSGRTDRENKEAVWDDQMFENLLTFANLNRGNPGALILFMNQSILRAPQSSATDGRGRLTGFAKTNPGNVPAEGVTIHITDGNINDETSDADGGYTTQSLPIGTYTAVFSKAGYVTITEPITVVDDGDTQFDVTLEPL